MGRLICADTVRFRITTTGSGNTLVFSERASMTGGQSRPGHPWTISGLTFAYATNLVNNTLNIAYDIALLYGPYRTLLHKDAVGAMPIGSTEFNETTDIHPATFSIGWTDSLVIEFAGSATSIPNPATFDMLVKLQLFGEVS